jgi:hypothetical protein
MTGQLLHVRDWGNYAAKFEARNQKPEGMRKIRNPKRGHWCGMLRWTTSNPRPGMIDQIGTCTLGCPSWSLGWKTQGESILGVQFVPFAGFSFRHRNFVIRH